MPDLGPHAAFLIAAYAVAFVALGTLTLVTVADDARQRRILREMERQGIRRRSAAKPPAPTVTRRTPKPKAAKPKAAKPKAAMAPPRRKPSTARARKTRS